MLEVEPITVARLVDRLERIGMVERRADDTDRRIWRLHLMDAAAAILGEIHDYRAAMTASLTAGMSTDKQGRLLDALASMKGLLSAERQTRTKEVA